MIDFNFIAGFIVGMVTCLGAISVLVIYACLVVGKRADENAEKMAEKRQVPRNGMREWHNNCVIWD